MARSSRYTKEERSRAVSEVLRGESRKSVAERYGVSVSTVANWISERETEEAEAERVAERLEMERAAELSRRTNTLVLLEIETEAGAVLAAVNLGRDGRSSGTVQRLAGAHVGPGPIRGRIVRRWAADARAMRSVAEGHLANLKAKKVL